MSRRKRFTRNLGRTIREPLPVASSKGWIRFEHQHEPYGVFTYADDTRELLSEGEAIEFEQLLEWFGEHLGAPDKLSEGRFWFKAEATEYISRARRLAAIVSSVGIPIVARRTRRGPGGVRWQDGHQIAVVTYRDAPQPTPGKGGE